MRKKSGHRWRSPGFLDYELTDVNEIIQRAEHLINPELAGEAILTVGSSLHEILHNVSGVISIGPFGCMPSRVAESILKIEMNKEGKTKAEKKNLHLPDIQANEYPYLAIETDGNLYPQIIQSKIEIFMLQADRLHKQLVKADLETKTKQAFTFKNLIERTLNGHYKGGNGRAHNEPGKVEVRIKP